MLINIFLYGCANILEFIMALILLGKTVRKRELQRTNLGHYPNI